MKVPYLGHSSSTQSSKSSSLRLLGPTERSDCNGKGSPSVLVPAEASLENNAEEENTEEDVTVVSQGPSFLYSHIKFFLKWSELIRLTVHSENHSGCVF